MMSEVETIARAICQKLNLDPDEQVRRPDGTPTPRWTLHIKRAESDIAEFRACMALAGRPPHNGDVPFVSDTYTRLPQDWRSR